MVLLKRGMYSGVWSSVYSGLGVKLPLKRLWSRLGVKLGIIGAERGGALSRYFPGVFYLDARLKMS